MVSYHKHLSEKTFDKVIAKFVHETFCAIIALTVLACLLLMKQLLNTNHLLYLKLWHIPLAIFLLLTIGLSIALMTVTQVIGDNSVSFQIRMTFLSL